ncbi:MAG: thioredoxin [Oscillospiraceae bacterium]|nr:thioredoxin [Oscillospiraceae bacterium]
MNKIARTLILITGLVFIVLGIWHDEPADIMNKAVTVCLECIGIG